MGGLPFFLCAAFAQSVLLANVRAPAQPCEPSWETGIGVPGADGVIRAFAVAGAGPSATLYAGGSFLTLGAAASPSIAAWNGAQWSSVGTGFNNAVMALTFFDDGSGPKLIAGGRFTSADGAAANRVALWTGSEWTGLSDGLAGSVLALAAYDDGQGPALYVGGDFTLTGAGAAVAHIARWKNNAWEPLMPGGVGPTISAVLALEVFDDGGGPALFVAGKFSSAGGAPALNIARWRNNAWSALGAGLNDEVDALAVHTDATGPALYAGGKFTASGTTSLSRIAKWQSGAWSALGTGFPEAVAVIRALVSFDDGAGPSLFVGGDYIHAGGVNASRVSRFHVGEWSALAEGADALVAALRPCSDASGPALAVGGNFSNAGATDAHYVAMWRTCAIAVCPPDLTGDGAVNSADLAQLLGSWGPGAPPADFNHDSFVNSADLATLLGAWGPCP